MSKISLVFALSTFALGPSVAAAQQPEQPSQQTVPRATMSNEVRQVHTNCCIAAEGHWNPVGLTCRRLSAPGKMRFEQCLDRSALVSR
jgi:hypothetical protein